MAEERGGPIDGGQLFQIRRVDACGGITGRSQAIATVATFDPVPFLAGSEMSLDAPAGAVQRVGERCGARGSVTEALQEGNPVRRICEETGSVGHRGYIAAT